MSYQGWKNWATWNIALWVGNDEPVYRAMRELLPFNAIKARRFVERYYPHGTPDMQGDRRTFPAYVGDNSPDWEAIADSFNEE